MAQFFSRVGKCLSEWNARNVWSVVVVEAAAYYLEHFPDILSRQEYTCIERRMVVEYPCIKHEGNDEWVCILCVMDAFFVTLAIPNG